MAKIQNVRAKEILDSRGLPTVEATVWLDDGTSVVTSVPSGTSVGKFEALELRDNDPNRMLGTGVLKAVDNVNIAIAPQLIGRDPTDQQNIDQLLVDLDGTANKAKLGANAILAVSQGVLKAGALSVGLPVYKYLQQKYQLTQQLSIPTCLYSIINGGEHGADNLDIQEFMIIPASFIDYPNSLMMAVVFQQKLEQVLVAKGAIHSIGLLGGFTPNLYNNIDVFEILVETIKTTPFTFAQDVFFGIDASAGSFADGNRYRLKDKPQPYTSKELMEFYKNIRSVYKVIYLEDPFEENDRKTWIALNAELGSTTKIVGDDILSTNREKITKGVEEKLCNTVVIKPTQTGTISESVDVARIAKEAGWQVVVSHRSGDTTDDLIADFAVGVGADYTKFGPTNRGERICKYNRLSQIYSELTPVENSGNVGAVPAISPTTVAPATSTPAQIVVPTETIAPSEPIITPEPAQAAVAPVIKATAAPTSPAIMTATPATSTITELIDTSTQKPESVNWNDALSKLQNEAESLAVANQITPPEAS